MFAIGQKVRFSKQARRDIFKDSSHPNYLRVSDEDLDASKIYKVMGKGRGTFDIISCDDNNYYPNIRREFLKPANKKRNR